MVREPDSSGGGSSRRPCVEVREAMLEVPPAELRPAPDSPIARHLAECPECERLAERLLAGDARLNRMLRSVALESAPGGWRQVPGRRRRRRRWAAAYATVMATAAGLLLLLGRNPVRMNPTWWPAEGRRAPAADVQVEGDATTVFASRDHTVTVVWLRNPNTIRNIEPVQPKEMN